MSRLMRSPERTILLCILWAGPFLLTTWVHGDGIGSVAFLRSVIVDRDLDLADEFDYLTTHIESDAGGLPGALLHLSDHTPGVDPIGHRPPPDPVTGRVPFFSTVGPPITWAPAYSVAHSVVLLGRRLGLQHEPHGYGGLYYLAIALTTLACGLGGLVLAYRFASSVAPQRETFWAVVSIAWASPLLYYLFMAPSYGPSITALTGGAFFLYWLKNRGSRDVKVWFGLGLLAGLLFIVRWNDLIFAIPIFAAETLRQSREAQSRKHSRPAWRLALCLCAAAAGCLAVASVQLGLWQYFHGRPLVRYPIKAVGFWTEGLWGTFVSARHGLFVWTPVTIPAVIGLFRLFKRDRELALVAIATLALTAASNCTIHDWWGGASFGMRRLVTATPLFVLGLAVFMHDITVALKRKISHAMSDADTRPASPALRFISPVTCLVFSVWNVLLLAQYATGMISHTGPVSFLTIAANQPRAVVRIIEILKELLL